jgi:hypothetical protein
MPQQSKLLCFGVIASIAVESARPEANSSQDAHPRRSGSLIPMLATHCDRLSMYRCPKMMRQEQSHLPKAKSALSSHPLPTMPRCSFCLKHGNSIRPWSCDKCGGKAAAQHDVAACRTEQQTHLSTARLGCSIYVFTMFDDFKYFY